AGALDASPGRVRTAAALALLAVGAAAGIVFGFGAPAVERTTATRAIPASVGEWTGTDVALGAKGAETLGTADLLFREYAGPRGALPVDLYVVHAADSDKVAHPPEICFSGGGFQPLEQGTGLLRAGELVIEANRLVMERNGQRLLVYYWYR